MPLPKPCVNCERKFQPRTKYTRLCEHCAHKIMTRPRKMEKKING